MRKRIVNAVSRTGAIKTVLVVTPGGQARTGGIAKIVEHTMGNWPTDSLFCLKIIDTFGPSGPVRGSARMPFYFLRAMLTVLYAVLSNSVDVLHLNMTERLSVWRKLSIALVGITFNIPVIVHMHGADFFEYFVRLPTWGQTIVRRIMNSCSSVLVLGSYWQDFVATKLAIPQHKIQVLYNAVPVVTKSETSSTVRCRLLFLGIVGERKGVDTLLSALAHPQMANEDWEAVIGGNGEISRFRQLSATLGIADRVEFTGLLSGSDVKDQFLQASVFVLPSRNEGLPVALIEAMSYGCAIVSTPVGSIGDAIISEETGLLVTPGDEQGLSDALFRLVTNNALRARLGRAAQSKFQESFTLPRYISDLTTVYENVTGIMKDRRNMRYQ